MEHNVNSSCDIEQSEEYLSGTKCARINCPHMTVQSSNFNDSKYCMRHENFSYLEKILSFENRDLGDSFEQNEVLLSHCYPFLISIPSFKERAERAKLSTFFFQLLTKHTQPNMDVRSALALINEKFPALYNELRKGIQSEFDNELIEEYLPSHKFDVQEPYPEAWIQNGPRQPKRKSLQEVHAFYHENNEEGPMGKKLKLNELCEYQLLIDELTQNFNDVLHLNENPPSYVDSPQRRRFVKARRDYSKENSNLPMTVMQDTVSVEM